MTKEPRVSAIIVNWNGAEHLRICLPSLASQSLKSLEIIVADNGSSDDSAAISRKLGARWLPLEKNLGLGPAMNRGAAIATGDLLLFINNDMRFDPGFVKALVEPILQNEDVFATDGMQFNWNGSLREHMAARLTARPLQKLSSTALVPGLFFYQHEAAEISPVFMASAACMMVRRALFEKLGGFDDRLPFGYEDVEICWRAWVHGWRTLYVPNAVCWHRVGGSVKSLQAARFSFRGVLTGRLLLATKLLPSQYVYRTWLVSILGLAKDLSRLRWKYASDRVNVLFHMAGLSAQLFHDKKALFNNANRSAAEQLGFLLSLTDENYSSRRSKQAEEYE